MSDTKTCRVCGETKDVSEFYASSAANRRRGGRLSYACKSCDRASALQRHARQMQSDPEHVLERKQAWAMRNREKARAAGAKHRLKIRLAVIEAYGGRCACCGETTIEFLSIDHVNGGGKAHREETRGHTYSDLYRNGFPEGYQVLCHNCNMAKGFYGQCPHQISK